MRIGTPVHGLLSTVVCAVALAWTAMPSTAHAQSCGVLTNSGFENGLSGWQNNGNSATNADRVSGSSAARTGTAAGGISRENIQIPSGATLRFEVQAKISGSPGWSGLGVGFRDASGNDLDDTGDQRQITQTSYTKQSFEIAAPANARFAYLWTWKTGNAGYLYVDDFCLTVVDNQAPSKPGNLRASDVTKNSFTLAWNAATDNVGVVRYDVRRNGTVIGSPTGTSFAVTGLSASTTYAMTVAAVDAGGKSTVSDPLNVTTASGGGGGGGGFPNIRVVGNHLVDHNGKPVAIRGIEAMYGPNSSSNPAAYAAGNKALGANAVGPLIQPGVATPAKLDALLSAAYNQGLIVGVNGDHTGNGEAYFKRKEIYDVINKYPNVFIQESVELGSINQISENQWVALAKAKIDAYVGIYPDKPIKIGSPSGGRHPRYALERCQEVVSYYNSKGGRGGVMFTTQLYWKASTTGTSWYQIENGFSSGLTGILEAVDEMAASPCMFLIGLDNRDDVGYTGWREVMDHVRASNSDPGKRISYQWWVLSNGGDGYENELTDDPLNPIPNITSTGSTFKSKIEQDRQLIELGPLNPVN